MSTALPPVIRGGVHGLSLTNTSPHGWVAGGRLEVVCGVNSRGDGCGGPLYRHDLECAAVEPRPARRGSRFRERSDALVGVLVPFRSLDSALLRSMIGSVVVSWGPHAQR